LFGREFLDRATDLIDGFRPPGDEIGGQLAQPLPPRDRTQCTIFRRRPTSPVDGFVMSDLKQPGPS